MAPISRYPGLQARVVVDGQTLTGYSDYEHSFPRKTSVYITAEPGDEYAIEYRIPGYLFEYDHIKVVISIDGVPMCKYIHDRYYGREHGTSRYVYCNVLNSYYEYDDRGRRFRFAMLNTDDSRERISRTLTNQLKSTGVISVTFYRVANIRYGRPPRKAPRLREYHRVPEKLMSRSEASIKTVLGPPEPIAPVSWMEADEVEYGPFATIQFKYRELGIIHIVDRYMWTQERPVEEPDRTDERYQYEHGRIKHESTPTLKRERSEDYDEEREVETRSFMRQCVPRIKIEEED